MRGQGFEYLLPPGLGISAEVICFGIIFGVLVIVWAAREFNDRSKGN